ncbi:MAG: terminase [Candidatus Rokuibacteriota bacterium]
MRPHLLAWQWSDYAVKHRSRANLLIHIAAVPLFQIDSLLVVWGVLGFAAPVAAVGAACVLASVALQGRGHRLEAEAPTPFDGAGDFVARLVAEQWITFPRFVLTGGWFRNLTAFLREP